MNGLQRSSRRLATTSVLLASACGGEEAMQMPVARSDNPAVEYPVELWDARIEGETVLAIHVDAEGLVDSVRVEDSSGAPGLDSAAVRNGHRMRFTPGRVGDRRVAAWIRVPIRFRRDSLGDGTGG